MLWKGINKFSHFFFSSLLRTFIFIQVIESRIECPLRDCHFDPLPFGNLGLLYTVLYITQLLLHQERSHFSTISMDENRGSAQVE